MTAEPIAVDDLTARLKQAMTTVPYRSPLWNRALAAFNATVHDGPIDAMGNAFAIVERGALEDAANARPVGGSHVGGSEWARGYAQGVRDKYDAICALIDAAADAESDPALALAERVASERTERLRRALEGRAVNLMGPNSPFWRCQYCDAAHRSPLMFEHKPDCLLAAGGGKDA